MINPDSKCREADVPTCAIGLLGQSFDQSPSPFLGRIFPDEIAPNTLARDRVTVYRVTDYRVTDHRVTDYGVTNYKVTDYRSPRAILRPVTIHWVYRFRSKINSLLLSTFISSKLITPSLLRSKIIRSTHNFL